MRSVVGIDPSLTGCAVATGTADAPEISEYASKPKGKSVAARASRYRALADAVASHVSGGYVFLEGYSFASKYANEAIAEFGWTLRTALIARGALVIEVPPTTLKKFAAGKGNAQKAAVGSELTRRYGVTFKTDNEADALGLLALGECVLELREPVTAAQKTTTEKVQETLRAIEDELARLGPGK